MRGQWQCCYGSCLGICYLQTYILWYFASQISTCLVHVCGQWFGYLVCMWCLIQESLDYLLTVLIQHKHFVRTGTVCAMLMPVTLANVQPAEPTEMWHVKTFSHLQTTYRVLKDILYSYGCWILAHVHVNIKYIIVHVAMFTMSNDPSHPPSPHLNTSQSLLNEICGT